MSSISFICNVCKQDIPVSGKVKGYKRCITCHREKEKLRRIINFRETEAYREKNRDKKKETRKQTRVKK